MTKRQSTLIKKFIIDISRMDHKQLKEFEEKLLDKEEKLDKIVFNKTLEACKIHKEELGEIEVISLVDRHKITIALMDLRKIKIFRRDWYMSKPDLEENIFKEVNEALDEREKELWSPSFSVIAETSELIEGDRADLR